MKITVDCFDPESVRAAVDAINRISNDDKRREAILKHVAEMAVEVAYTTYQGAVDVEARKIGDGYAIIASGERVCFIEFGTGMYAIGHMNALADERKLGFKVEPGSWSMTEGMRTWADWQDRPAQYPWNRVARPGMYEAYKAIQRNIAQWAKEAIAGR